MDIRLEPTSASVFLSVKRWDKHDNTLNITVERQQKTAQWLVSTGSWSGRLERAYGWPRIRRTDFVDAVWLTPNTGWGLSGEHWSQRHCDRYWRHADAQAKEGRSEQKRWRLNNTVPYNARRSPCGRDREINAVPDHVGILISIWKKKSARVNGL